MIMTNNIILKGISYYGGWSKHQLEAIGGQWPPKQGWKINIIGKEVDEKKVELFLYLKNYHIKNVKKRKKGKKWNKNERKILMYKEDNELNEDYARKVGI